MDAVANLNISQTSRPICLARQPIVDNQYNVYGYELLFRRFGDQVAHIENEAQATVELITNFLSNIGLKSVLGKNKLAFININEQLLSCDLLDILPPDKVMLEILEHVSPTDSVINNIKQKHDQEFHFALDDFIYFKGTEKFLPYVDLIKIDITQLDRKELLWHIDFAKKHNKEILAEKVENSNEFELCQSLGCDYYQGYFFAKPIIVSQKSIPDNKLKIFEVMNLIMQDASNDIIESSICKDLSISFKLLKFINSAALRRDHVLNNIKDALALLGRKPLYRWLSILLFSNDDNINIQNDALFNLAIFRGRMMEYLGETHKIAHPGELFVLGMFSFLDALLNISIDRIIKDIAIPQNIKDALINNKGPYWPYLNLAKQLDADDISQQTLDDVGVKMEDLNGAICDAMTYCENFNQA